MHARVYYVLSSHECSNTANANTLYDPSFEERGLYLDPHLRCFALEQAKKNGGECFLLYVLFYYHTHALGFCCV